MHIYFVCLLETQTFVATSHLMNTLGVDSSYHILRPFQIKVMLGHKLRYKIKVTFGEIFQTSSNKLKWCQKQCKFC